MTRLLGPLKRSRVLARLLYSPYAEADRPRPQASTVERLNEVFRPDIEKLKKLLSLDLGHWLDGSAAKETAS